MKNVQYKCEWIHVHRGVRAVGTFLAKNYEKAEFSDSLPDPMATCTNVHQFYSTVVML